MNTLVAMALSENWWHAGLTSKSLTNPNSALYVSKMSPAPSKNIYPPTIQRNKCSDWYAQQIEEGIKSTNARLTSKCSPFSCTNFCNTVKCQTNFMHWIIISPQTFKQFRIEVTGLSSIYIFLNNLTKVMIDI